MRRSEMVAEPLPASPPIGKILSNSSLQVAVIVVAVDVPSNIIGNDDATLLRLIEAEMFPGTGTPLSSSAARSSGVGAPRKRGASKVTPPNASISNRTSLSWPETVPAGASANVNRVPESALSIGPLPV